MKRVTVEDVAQHAGVSTATVSRAMSGSDAVTPKTRARVMAAVRELGFSPTPAAQNLRQQRTRNVALVIPSIVNPFFPELVGAIHPGITSHGCSLLLIDSTESERSALSVATSRIADGVLLVGSTAKSARATTAPPVTVPVVALDRAPSDWSVNVVQCENELGARKVVAHLLELGHREIAHITGPRGIDVADHRTSGYQKALNEHGISLRSELIRTGDFSEDAGFESTLSLIDAGVKFTALFAANDMAAIGALAALKARGLTVPDDVAVAGFDGIHLTRYVNPALTTYAQPITTIAQHATDLLLKKIKGTDDGEEPQIMQFPGKLIIRESTDREGSRL